MSKRLIAIGSAHLDIIAVSHGDPHGIDQPGEVRVDIGGTACNLAINWVRMGAESVLLTAFRPGPIAALIQRHLAEQGVEVIADENPMLSVGGYCAHLDEDGELLAAISDASIETHEFNPERLEEAFEGADMIVADCNLSEEALSAVGFEAISRAAPLYLRAVSEEKSLRMAAVRGLPTLVSLTEREAKYFLFQIQNRILKDPLELAQAMAEFMKCDCLLLLQERGAIYAPPDGPAKWERQEDFSFAGNRLGAEEGLLAAFVLACSHGASPLMALPRALRVGGLIANKDQVNLGEARPLELALRELLSDDLKSARPSVPSPAQTKLDRRIENEAANGFCAVLIHISSLEPGPGLETGARMPEDRAFLNDMAKEIIRALTVTSRSADLTLRWSDHEIVCVFQKTSRAQAQEIAGRALLFLDNERDSAPVASFKWAARESHAARESFPEAVEKTREALNDSPALPKSEAPARPDDLAAELEPSTHPAEGIKAGLDGE